MVNGLEIIQKAVTRKKKIIAERKASKPVASALGGGVILASGEIVRGSFPSAGFQTSGGGGSSAPTQSFPKDTSVPRLSVDIFSKGRTISQQLKDNEDLPKSELRIGEKFITEGERKRGAVGFIIGEKTPTQVSDKLSRLERVGQVFSSPRTGVERIFGSSKGRIISSQAQIFAIEEKAKILGDVEKDLALDPSLLIGKEGVTVSDVEGGRQIQLSPVFFESKFEGIDNKSVERATQFFKDLPFKRRATATGVSIATGITSAEIGFVEFGLSLGANLGVQKFEEGQTPKSASFEFGGSLGNIRSQLGVPTTTTFLKDPIIFSKQKLSDPKFSAELGVGLGVLALGGSGALSNIRQFGLKGGLIETGAVLSPFRFQPKILSAPLKKTNVIDAINLQFKTPKGDKLGAFAGVGKDDPFIITSKQITKTLGGKDISLAEVQVVQPATVFRGGKFIEGFKISQFEGLSGAVGGGKASFRLGDFVKIKDIKLGNIDFLGVKGGIATSLTQPKFGAFVSEEFSVLKKLPKSSRFKIGKTAGVSSDISEGVSFFGLGKRKAIFDIGTTTGGLGTLRFPTGKFKFKPTVTGKQFDINKLLELGKRDLGLGLGRIRTGGIKKTPLDVSFKLPKNFFKSPKSVLKPPKTILKPPIGIQSSLGLSAKTTPPIVSSEGVSSLIGIPRSVGGLGLTEKQFLGLKLKGRISQTDTTLPKISTNILQNLGFGLEEKSATKLKSFVRTSQIPKTSTALRSLQAQSFTFKSPTKQLQKQTTFPPRGRFGFELGIPFGFGFPPIIPPFLGGGVGRKKKKKGRKVKVRIAPSLTGILTGLKGLPKTTKIGGVDVGILPGQLRGIPRRKKSKSRVKKRRK